MARRRHPNKDIETALQALEALGWVVEEAKGKSAHGWGFALCPANAGDICRSGPFCRMSVWSTPRNPASHARDLVKRANGCLVKGTEDE